MAAYVIVDVEITNPSEYEEYKKHTPAAVAAFGGRFLSRGGKVESLEGEWKPERIVLLEFPTLEKAKEWWNSDLYTTAKIIRQRAANTRMIVADGV